MVESRTRGRARRRRAVARRGARSEREARDAFDSGVATLDVVLPMPDRASMTLESVGRALDELEEARPEMRVALLDACMAASAHDGVVRPGEYEMIRAIADAMGLVMPLILPGRVDSGASA